VGAVLSNMSADSAGESEANQDQDPTGKRYLIRLFLWTSAIFLLIMALVIFDQESMPATPIGVAGLSAWFASYAMNPQPLMIGPGDRLSDGMNGSGMWSRGFLVLGAAFIVTSFILKMVG
jgi:hypothetical protein